MFKWINKMKNRKEGFTLVELLVVMAILAILVALGAPRFLGYTKDAKVTAMQADAKIIEQASYQYALNNDDNWPVAVDASGNTITAQDDQGQSLLDTSTAGSEKFVDATLQAIVEKALIDKVEGIDSSNAASAVSALITNNAFVEIDKTKVSKFIRSTKNDIEAYFLVNRTGGIDLDGDPTNGMEYNDELEGVVFADVPQVDSNGVYYSGLFADK